MLDIKKTLTKLMSKAKQTDDRFEIETLPAVAYTSSTSWAKAGTITIQKSGLYEISAKYANAAVNGLAIASANATAINASKYIVENTTASTITMESYLAAGSYSYWAKCAAAGKTNNITTQLLIAF